MKVIRDIRLFQSQIPNIDGNSLPSAAGSTSLAVKLHRVVMKLREQGFSLGSFDHLYINFTTCAVPGKMAPAERRIDRQAPWYRFYDVEAGPALFAALDTGVGEGEVLLLTETLLKTFFASETFGREKIHACFHEALTLNEAMEMKFKEKHSARYHAVLSLRYLDDGTYAPLLRVTDRDGQTVLERTLPPVRTLERLGELSLSAGMVTVKPRKNAYTHGMAPVSFRL